MNNSILFLTENIHYTEKLKNQSNENFHFHFLKYNKFYLHIKDINSYELIIFDNSDYSLIKFKEVLKQFEDYNFDIPIIILQNKTLNDLSIYKSINTYAIFEQNINENSLLANIEICLHSLCKNKKIQFENNFYFHLNKKTLFKGKKIIELTNIENKLINLLISNVNNVINYEDISKKVWKDKKYSIFTLRNTVKHIREKTYETFIQNSSKRGYVIKIYN